MSSEAAVVEIVKAARKTLVEDGATTEGKSTVGAGREASVIDGTGLGWSIKLELIVGNNTSGAALTISQGTTSKCEGERARSVTGGLPLSITISIHRKSSGNLKLTSSMDRFPDEVTFTAEI